MNTLSIEYLTLVLGQFYPQIERSLSIYEHMISELDTLIDVIDQLSNGLLSPSVIRPRILQERIMQVDIDLRNHFAQYTLALSVAEMYYNIPMVKFMFLKDMLGVQIPLFLQHHTQQALNLYSLRTDPIPHQQRNI